MDGSTCNYGRLDLSRSISEIVPLKLKDIAEGIEKLEKQEGNPYSDPRQGLTAPREPDVSRCGDAYGPPP